MSARFEVDWETFIRLYQLILFTLQTKTVDYDIYCYDSIVQKLFTTKTRILTSLSSSDFTRSRNHTNPYEYIGKSVFVNRSAVKMANIDKLMGITEQWCKSHPSTTQGNSEGPVFQFVDLCAGPGGFTEYLLWRLSALGHKAHGWGLTLTGEQDFQVDKFHTAVAEIAINGGFEAYYGVDGSGDICLVENVEGFAEKVGTGTNHQGVDLVTGDGVSIEKLSFIK
jgi:hypothetical protein